MNKPLPALHIVNKSPFAASSLEQCLQRLAVGDSLLLIEDAVYAAITEEIWDGLRTQPNKPARILALSPDLCQRGLADKSLAEGIEQVDYAGFVELVTTHNPIHSW
ncbi:MAG TPA: sulfurtransferase complex subunit TusB [Rhodospirillaceae bacterium]|nr:sulfurtransferase complex subunit TusB [Rhodospirillaceae bacterium]